MLYVNGGNIKTDSNCKKRPVCVIQVYCKLHVHVDSPGRRVTGSRVFIQQIMSGSTTCSAKLQYSAYDNVNIMNCSKNT